MVRYTEYAADRVRTLCPSAPELHALWVDPNRRQALIDQLEEEHRADDDYFIDSATIDVLEEAGASTSLIALLRQAVGNSEGIDVRYEK